MTSPNITSINKSTPSQSELPANAQHFFTSLQDQMNRFYTDFLNTPSLLSMWRNTHLFNPDFLRKTPFRFIEPALDIDETDKTFRLRMELPGVDEKNVKITMNDRYMTIKGEKEQSHREESKNSLRCECSYGSFERTVYLPETANADEAQATWKNGVLTIEMPKRANASHKTRQIEIKKAA